MFACSYAVTVLRGYDKVVAAITWLPWEASGAAGGTSLSRHVFRKQLWSPSIAVEYAAWAAWHAQEFSN